MNETEGVAREKKPQEDNNLEACIGSLEHHIHKVFASVRVPGEDFVYTPSTELYRELDAYCDHRTFNEIKQPFLVKGESGTGKSALLSNWLRRRKRVGPRARATDEFVFWHAVGCSRQSLNINSLLRRLMMELKSRFELSRELPSNQERLSWELPRFLDAASRRGKIIVVIDGLHRIANNDDSEGNLAWLPLVLPPGVRFIVSATVMPTLEKKVKPPLTMGASLKRMPSQTGDLLTGTGQTVSNSPPQSNASSPKNNDQKTVSSGFHVRHAGYHQVAVEDDSSDDEERKLFLKNFRGRRIMAELERRQLKGLRMKRMDRHACRAMIDAYVKKSVQTAVAAAHATRGALGTFLGLTGGRDMEGVTDMNMNMGDPEIDSLLSGFPMGGIDGAGASSKSEEQGFLEGSVSGKAVSDFIPGFLLFESQINVLLDHSHGSTPLFLRLILRCAHNAVARGFSLWRIWDNWLEATSVGDLLERILSTLEKGHSPTLQSMKEDTARTIQEGGLAALVQMYPWHPSLRRIHRHAQEASDKLKKQLMKQQQQQAMEEKQNSINHHLRAGESFLSVDSSTQQGNGADDDTVQLAHLIAMSKPVIASDDDDGHNASSTSVVTGIGAAGMNGNVPYPLDAGGSLASSNGSKTVSNPLSLVNPSSTMGMANNASSVAAHTLSSGGTAAAQMGLGITKGAGTSILQSLGDQQWLTASQHAEIKLDDALRAAEKGVDRAMNNAKRAAVTTATPVSGSMLWKENNLHTDSASVVSMDRGYIDVMMDDIIAKSNHVRTLHTPPTTAKVSRPNALLKALQESAGNTPNDTEPQSRDASPSNSQLLADGEGEDFANLTASQRSRRINSVALNDANAAKQFSMSDVESMLDEAKRKEDEENFVPEKDPVEVAMVGQNSLPEYLRGGSVSQGLGALMGNALSLLFVARHGLKEAELWAMLATLRARPPEYIEMLQRQRVQQEASRAVLQICYNARGDLEDHWRVEDHVRTGMLTLAQLQRGMLKASKDLKRGDLMRLLQITGLMAQEAIDAGFVTGNTGGEMRPNMAYDQGPSSMGKGQEAGSPEAVRVYFPELLHRILSGEKRERWNVHRRHLGLHHDYEHIGLGGVVSSDTRSVGSQDDFNVPGNVNAQPVVQAVPATNVSFKDPFNNSGVDAGGSASVLGDDLATLGPVIEENLLELLTALGALHSPEHQVILLPSENHSFRSVIRSIVEQRGGEEAWHGHMIRYFQKLPNTSMRRCEELPWHLQLCRKWYVLKDALSDLKTFDMMYSSDDLKDELLSYWRLLTEGPLCILSDEQLQAEIDERLSALETQKLARVTALWRAAREAKSHGHSRRSSAHPTARFTARGGGNDRDSSDAGNEQIDLDDLDEDELDPAAFPDDQHEARCRQIIMNSVSNDVGPFDIVEEFNRSVETWVLGIGAPASSIPGAAQINATILHIGQFIAEFSVRGGSSPPFLRLGVGIDALSNFKVTFGSIQELLVPEDKDDIITEEALLAVTKTLVGVKPKAVVPMFPTRQMENSHLYLYLRWIWTQFPWLALMHAGTCIPGPTASAIMHKRHQSAFGNSLFEGNNGSLNSMGEIANNVVGGQLTDAIGDFGDLTMANEKNNGRRFWTVKKADPTVALFEYTQPKRTANINAAITPSSYMNTIEVVVQRVRDDIKAEMTDPDNRLTPVKEKIDVSVKRLPRFRRSLEQDVEANKQVLLAGHSLKTQLKGTMFPSIEMQRKAAYKKIEDDHPGLYVTANLVKRRGGQSDPFGPSVEEEIRQLRDSEDLKDYNDKRGYPIALTSEDAVYYEKECLRVEKLRKLMDRVTAKVAERKADLNALKYKVKTRDKHDEEIAADVMAGDAALGSLEFRISEMVRAQEDAKALGRGYETLIELLKTHPPTTQAHIKAQEQTLVLARQQLNDLKEHRQKTLHEVEVIEQHTKGQIIEKIAYYRNERQDLRKQLYVLYRDASDKKQQMPPPKHDSLLYRFYKKIRRKLIIRKRAIRSKKRLAIAQKFLRLSSEKSRSDQNPFHGSFIAPLVSRAVSRAGKPPHPALADIPEDDNSGKVFPVQGKIFSGNAVGGIPPAVMAAADTMTTQRQRKQPVLEILSFSAQEGSDDNANKDKIVVRGGIRGGALGEEEQARRKQLLRSHRLRQGLPDTEPEEGSHHHHHHKSNKSNNDGFAETPHDTSSSSSDNESNANSSEEDSDLSGDEKGRGGNRRTLGDTQPGTPRDANDEKNGTNGAGGVQFSDDDSPRGGKRKKGRRKKSKTPSEREKATAASIEMISKLFVGAASRSIAKANLNAAFSGGSDLEVEVDVNRIKAREVISQGFESNHGSRRDSNIPGSPEVSMMQQQQSQLGSMLQQHIGSPLPPLQHHSHGPHSEHKKHHSHLHGRKSSKQLTAATTAEAAAAAKKKANLDMVMEMFDPKKKKERQEAAARNMQAKMFVDFLMDRSKSLNEDQFIERYRTATKLSDSLRLLQIQADSKLLVLKAQLADLQVVWDETAVLEASYVGERRSALANKHHTVAMSSGGSNTSAAANLADSHSKDIEGGNNSSIVEGDDMGGLSRGSSRPAESREGGDTSATPAGVDSEKVAISGDVETDGRHLDSAMFAAEMRQQHVRRKLDSSAQLINEIRLGVTAIMSMLDANEKLLQNLPKSQRPPPMLSDQDIAANLTWCEERITAMTEAMVLDAGGASKVVAQGSKPEEEKLPLHQRQANLAKLVQKMVKHSSTQEEATTKILNNKKKLKPNKDQDVVNTTLLRLLVDLRDPNTTINSPRNVVIPNDYETEHQYNINVNKNMEQATKRAEHYEAQMAKKREAQALGDSHDVQRFLHDALASSTNSTAALRKSNFLSNRPIKGGLGYALENLFANHGYGTELHGLTGNVMPQLESIKRTAEQIEKDRLRGRGGPAAMRSAAHTGGGKGRKQRKNKNSRNGTANDDDDDNDDNASLTSGTSLQIGDTLNNLSDAAKTAMMALVRPGTGAADTPGAEGGGRVMSPSAMT